jgi:2-amino-4-hydroxy-6-hydroxymethyldihydropteridine diphosphokinase
MEKSYNHRVWIGLGSNLGDRSSNLAAAQRSIVLQDCRLISVSSIYESAPWGYESGNMFYNQCLVLETDLSPEAMLRMLQKIESEMGRVQSTGGYADRIIDLDLLFFDDLVMHTDDLVLPHPKLEERMFVLRPLAEIAPQKIHPVTGLTVSELFEKLPGKESVQPV